MTTTELYSACRQRCIERFSTSASRFFITLILLSSFAFPSLANSHSEANTATIQENTAQVPSAEVSTEPGIHAKQDGTDASAYTQGASQLSGLDKMVVSLMGPASSSSAMDKLVDDVTRPASIKKPTIESLTAKITDKYSISENQAREIVLTAYREAKARNLDPVLVLSIIATESSFNPKAKSKVGALGLMQAMPVYHREKLDRLGISQQDLYHPEHNIRVGTEILSEYIHMSKGNTASALQRYNGSLSDGSRKYSNKVFRAMTWLSSP